LKTKNDDTAKKDGRRTRKVRQVEVIRTRQKQMKNLKKGREVDEEDIYIQIVL